MTNVLPIDTSVALAAHAEFKWCGPACHPGDDEARWSHVDGPGCAKARARQEPTTAGMPAASEIEAEVDKFYWGIGQRIIAGRRIRSLTQQQLADAIGLTRASVANAEAGRQRSPLHILFAVARTLNIGFFDLVVPESVPGGESLAAMQASERQVAHAYTSGWRDAVAAWRMPGRAEREAAWKAYKATVTEVPADELAGPSDD